MSDEREARARTTPAGQRLRKDLHLEAPESWPEDRDDAYDDITRKLARLRALAEELDRILEDPTDTSGAGQG